MRIHTLKNPDLGESGKVELGEYGSALVLFQT